VVVPPCKKGEKGVGKKREVCIKRWVGKWLVWVKRDSIGGKVAEKWGKKLKWAKRRKN
jgi:hypothetical protein